MGPTLRKPASPSNSYSRTGFHEQPAFRRSSAKRKVPLHVANQIVSRPRQSSSRGPTQSSSLLSANSGLTGCLSSGVHRTVSFSAPVRDPVLHLSSLASTLVFSAVNLTKLSGEATLTVLGNRVSGVINDIPVGHDANGTIRLNGIYSAFSFTAEYRSTVVGSREDGILIQIGATAVPESRILPQLLSVEAGIRRSTSRTRAPLRSRFR
jgi:hypothetical protein